MTHVLIKNNRFKTVLTKNRLMIQIRRGYVFRGNGFNKHENFFINRNKLCPQ